MILLGYHQTGAYRLFDPNTKKIVISADVVFDEWRGWNWDRLPNSQTKFTWVNSEGENSVESGANQVTDHTGVT